MILQVVVIVLCLILLVLLVRERKERRLLQKQAEQDVTTLENTNRLMDAILSHINAYVLLIDSDFIVLKTNYYELTGHKKGDKEKRVGDLLQCRNALDSKGGCGTHAFCASCPVRMTIGKAFAGKTNFTELESSLTIALSDNEYINCNVIISGIYMNINDQDLMVITVHDITHLKQVEEALTEARERAENADRSKSAFLANMSHEIRTPLNAIIGFSEILAAAHTQEEKDQYLGIVKTNGDQLLQLVNDILDLSKIEAGTLEFVYSDVDINHLMDELKQLFQMRVEKEGGVQIVAEKGLPSCVVHTDRNRLAQVVSNFVTNAIKFTNQGSISIGYKPCEDGLYFYVIDTGAGIEPEKLGEVFNRFVKLQTNKKGTGLGLSICKTIVNKLGGEIGVESTVGKGSTFWFTLPYHSDVKPKVIIEKDAETVVEKQPEMEQKVIISPDENRRLTVLVAEDMEDNYRLCEAILSSRYTLLWAHNGEEAISMYLQHQPDIILMDIRMPEVNGYEATEAIRQISPTVPIIALTAFAYDEDRKKVMESGFTDFMTKPISSRVLLDKLESLKKI